MPAKVAEKLALAATPIPSTFQRWLLANAVTPDGVTVMAGLQSESETTADMGQAPQMDRQAPDLDALSLPP